MVVFPICYTVLFHIAATYNFVGLILCFAYLSALFLAMSEILAFPILCK